MPLPNLIIGGAPKCGTSSLYHWLSDHPQACGSLPKETFYLMDEEHPLLNSTQNVHSHGLSGYKEFFATCQPNSRIIFEATTHYLYQQTPIDVLSKFDPHPHVIFVLRDPAEQIYSSFRYTKNNLARMKEDISFATYVDMLEGRSDRKVQEVFHSRRDAYVHERHLGYGHYADYLQRWMQTFDTGKIHVLLFEDLVASPLSLMKRVSSLVGITPDFYESYDFPHKNSTRRIRHTYLHRLARICGAKLPDSALKHSVKQLYLKLQTRSRAPMVEDDSRALRRLDTYFADSTQRLAELTGLNVTRWGKR